MEASLDKIYEDIVVEEVEAAVPAIFDDLPDSVNELRKRAYETLTDHLYFKEAAGELPPGTWLRKRAEVKAQFPQKIKIEEVDNGSATTASQ